MSDRSLPRRMGNSVLAWLRPVLGILLFLIVYGGLRAVFFLATEGYGVLGPSGATHPWTALFGATLLVLRLVVVFGVPAVVTYRLLCRRFLS